MITKGRKKYANVKVLAKRIGALPNKQARLAAQHALRTRLEYQNTPNGVSNPESVRSENHTRLAKL